MLSPVHEDIKYVPFLEDSYSNETLSRTIEIRRNLNYVRVNYRQWMLWGYFLRAEFYPAIN